MHRFYVGVGAVLAFTLLGLPSRLIAADIIYFNDTFDSAGATRDSNANDAADIPWFTRGNNGAGLAVQSDAGGIGSGNVLRYAPSAGAQLVFGSFDNDVADNNPAAGVASPDSFVSLGNVVGDVLRLRMTFRYAAPPPIDSTGLLIGLFGDPDGTYVTADNSGVQTDDSPGYYARIPLNGDMRDAALIRETGTDGQVAGGSDGSTIAQNASVAMLNDAAAHRIQLEFTRLEGGSARISCYYDDFNTPILSAVDASPFTDFNLLAIRSSAGLTEQFFDDVSLSTPEPGSACVASVAMVGLLARRRRGS